MLYIGALRPAEGAAAAAAAAAIEGHDFAFNQSAIRRSKLLLEVFASALQVQDV